MTADKFLLNQQLINDALEYHSTPTAGKLQVLPTKPLITQRDLSLAYTPGVAAPCLEINKQPLAAYQYTNKGNLVAVISNGTAVLGLGNIGALAGKPVMEGKAVLFKKLAGIDVFDIEVNETAIDKFVDIVAALEPTFGAINLEDIKAPECFIIEEKLQQRLAIPVFHDDQHGTAIVVAAGIVNGLYLVNKQIEQVKIVVSGAGAASTACLNLLVAMGAKKSNIFVSDSQGIIHSGRQDLDANKLLYCQDTLYRSLEDAMVAADIFLGVSGPNTITAEAVAKMAAQPLVFALANPTPEIMPEVVRQVRSDAIIATGRSDYPNQINNALCFPYIFRGALDVGATTINQEMKLATVAALAQLARNNEYSELIQDAYNNEKLSFGSEYIIPKPLDPSLILAIAPAVAKAAIASGVATRPIADMTQYTASLNKYVYKSDMFMRPIFKIALIANKHIVLCEGEDERVLKAAQEIIEQKLAKLTLIGRTFVIEKRLQALGLRITPDKDFAIIDNEHDERFRAYWSHYYNLTKRRGITPEAARREVIRNTTLIGALSVNLGVVDGLICGTFGQYAEHLKILTEIIGYNNDKQIVSTVNALMLPQGNLFIADPFINPNPSAQELSYITIQAVNTIKHFGIKPAVALLSHSNFGSDLHAESAVKMRQVLALVKAKLPDLEIDGEMQADAALVNSIRNQVMPDSTLKRPANLLIMPDVVSANIAYNLLRVSAPDVVSVGPIINGLAKPVHILNAISSPRRIVNMVALACVEASLLR